MQDGSLWGCDGDVEGDLIFTAALGGKRFFGTTNDTNGHELGLAHWGIEGVLGGVFLEVEDPEGLAGATCGEGGVE